MFTRPSGAVYIPPGQPDQTGQSGVDPGITSYAELAAVLSGPLMAGTIKIWVEAATGLQKTSKFYRQAAPDPAPDGVTIPNDYDVNNPGFWADASV